LLTLLLMALLRIQRPEHLKERDPAAFGRLLGLDRAPEVKTLRRGLTRLAAHQHAEQLGAELARLRVDQRGHLMGFLYVDGHVRAYHGERTISRAIVARRHLAMPATTDYWVNDRAGDPLLLITGDINAALTKAFPDLLREVRAVIGERRATIVFDRGGWSPKLFHTMIQDGFDILTYRKGKGRLVHQRRFVHRRAKLDGRWVSYDLHDQPVRFLKGKLRLRQVTRLCDNGHQTQVITNRCKCRAPHFQRVVVSASPEYLERRGTPKHPSELLSHDCIAWSTPGPLDTFWFKDGGAEKTFPIRTRLSTTSADSAVAAALTGLGLVQTTSYQAEQGVRDGRLVVVLPKFECAPTPVSLVYAGNRLVPLKLRAFIDFASPRLSERLRSISATVAGGRASNAVGR